MQELTAALETRCFDVFNLNGTKYQLERAILARGLFVHYFSKISDYLFKTFRTDFRLNWSYTNRVAFVACYSSLATKWNNVKFSHMDGLQHYFYRAEKMIKSLALNTDNNIALALSFANFPSPYHSLLPRALNGARTFVDGHLTMAGLLVFLNPLLSANDCQRLMEDIARTFARNISYYQGLHLEAIVEELKKTKATVFEPFESFFSSDYSSSLTRLTQVLFGDKAPYAIVTKEEPERYSFDLDLTAHVRFTTWHLAGTIKDEGATYLVSYDPIKTKVDVLLPKEGCAVRLDKNTLTALLPFAEKTPAGLLVLSFAIIWPGIVVDGLFLRSVSAGLMHLETGAYWFDDKERFDEASEPIYRTALCLPYALAQAAINIVKSPLLPTEQKEKLRNDIARISKHVPHMRKMWVYNLDYDTEIANDDGSFFFYSVDDLANDLSLAYNILGEYAPNTIMANLAKDGCLNFMALLFEERYTGALEFSRRMLDPLSVSSTQWQQVLSDGLEEIKNTEKEPLIPDSAIATMAPCGITLDAYVYADEDYLEAAGNTARFFKGLTKVKVKSTDKNIFVKGKDTGLKELTFFVTDEQNDMQSIAGPLGEPTIIVSKQRKLDYIDEIEMAL